MYVTMKLADITETMCMELVRGAIANSNPMTIEVAEKKLLFEDVTKDNMESRVVSLIPQLFDQTVNLEISNSKKDGADSPNESKTFDKNGNDYKEVNSREAENTEKAEKAEKAKKAKKAEKRRFLASCEAQEILAQKLDGKVNDILSKTQDSMERFSMFLDALKIGGITNVTFKKLATVFIEFPKYCRDNDKDITFTELSHYMSRSDGNIFAIKMRNFMLSYEIDDKEGKLPHMEIVKYYDSKFNN